MKSVYGAIGLIASVVIVIYIGVTYLGNTTIKMGDLITEIEQKVNQDDFDGATESFENLNDLWGKNEKYFCMLIHRNRIDELEEKLVVLRIYVAEKELTDIKSQIEGIRLDLGQIKESESLSFSILL